MPKEGVVNNPTGKGGFGENPENRSDGRWNKDTSISYWYNYLIRLTIEDFDNFKCETKVQKLAYLAVVESEKELNYLKELTDRTEGKAPQSIDHSTKGEKIGAFSIEIVDNTNESD